MSSPDRKKHTNLSPLPPLAVGDTYEVTPDEIESFGLREHQPGDRHIVTVLDVGPLKSPSMREVVSGLAQAGGVLRTFRVSCTCGARWSFKEEVA